MDESDKLSSDNIIDAAELDPAELSRRFEELEDQFRRSHGAPSPEPASSPEDIPVTLDALFSDKAPEPDPSQAAETQEAIPPLPEPEPTQVQQQLPEPDPSQAAEAQEAIPPLPEPDPPQIQQPLPEPEPPQIQQTIPEPESFFSEPQPAAQEDVPLTLDALFSEKAFEKPAASAPIETINSADTETPHINAGEAIENTEPDRPLTLDEIFSDDGAKETAEKTPGMFSKLTGFFGKRAEKDDSGFVERKQGPAEPAEPGQDGLNASQMQNDKGPQKGSGQEQQGHGNGGEMAGSAHGENRNGGNRNSASRNSSNRNSANRNNRNGGNRNNASRNSSNRNSANRNNRNNPNRNNPNRNRPGKNGRRRKKRPRESIVAKIIKWFVSVIAVIIIAVMIFGLVYVYGIIKDTPRFDPRDIESSLKVMSTIYDDQGQPLKNIYLPEGQRTLVEFDQLPGHLVDAFVAIEDKTFWTHRGFNVVRIFGAVIESLGGSSISGTSTITQQLARNIWLFEERTERTLDRKVREAFYARELENNLSKEQIITAYLNTISLGNHSYGIVAAAENYFGKSVEDLTLIESAALAALPQAPSQYAMILTVSPGEVAPDDPRILLTGAQYVYIYNDKAEPRIKLVLSLMLEQELITQEEYDKAVNDNIRRHLRPREIEISSNADFFVSYAISQVADDLLKYDPEIASRDEAIQKIYSGGLDIYTTFNQRAQDIATEEFNDPENFPYTKLTRTDELKNITDEDGFIILFSHDYMFETTQFGRLRFHLIADGEAVPYAWGKGRRGFEEEERRDFRWREDGSMEIFAGAYKRLGIYRTEFNGIVEPVLEFKDFYTVDENGVLFITKGGQIHIPAEYKGMTERGNLILSSKFFDSDYNIFTMDSDGELWIDYTKFTLRQEVMQPQGAFVLIEHGTGQIKAMVGGRDIKGQFQFDRSRSPRPPGSSIKPIAVYAPAIEMSANGEQVGGNIPTFGPYWSPVSIIIDEQMKYKGEVWPKNWYSGFRGPQTMRYSIEQSINVNAVKTQLAIGDQRSINFLQKLGITSLVLEQVNGVSDLAPGALALGGMTKGISPFEMASAYGAFANAGVRVTPITYTEVRDKRGKVILDGTPQEEQVMNPGTAFIMNDMLTSTVSQGLATAAKVPGTIVAGKTGTTSEYYDAWFVGNTPKYSAAVWIGCDVQVELSAGSKAASALFSKLMGRIIEGEEQGEFPPQPENVTRATVSSRPMNNPDSVQTFTDYFIVGTIPQYIDLGMEEVRVCSETGFMATPWCPAQEDRQFSTMPQPDDEDLQTETAPKFFCNMHNLDPLNFPPDPAYPFNYDFGKSQVPDLFGLTLGQALDALTNRNLRIGEIFPDVQPTPPETFSPSVDDIVISQNPPFGQMIPENSMVNITVRRVVKPVIPEPPAVPETTTTTNISVNANQVSLLNVKNIPGIANPGIQRTSFISYLIRYQSPLYQSPLRSSVAS